MSHDFSPFGTFPSHCKKWVSSCPNVLYEITVLLRQGLMPILISSLLFFMKSYTPLASASCWVARPKTITEGVSSGNLLNASRNFFSSFSLYSDVVLFLSCFVYLNCSLPFRCGWLCIVSPYSTSPVCLGGSFCWFRLVPPM